MIRDYAEEAAQIAAGQSVQRVELAHLVAMAAQLRAAAVNVQTVNRVLAAVMLDADVRQILIPNKRLQQVRESRTRVLIVPRPDGSVRVTRVGADPPVEAPGVPLVRN